MRPSISVIVPVYNVQEYLPECLESLLNQDFKDMEIILVNDGSTDRSGAICDEYAKEYPRIRVIHQDNAGVSSARNAGLNNAAAPYISFVDSDDFVAKDMISRLFNLIVEKNCDISVGGVKEYNYKGETTETICQYKEETVLAGDDILLSLLNNHNGFANIWCKIYRRELLENIFFQNIKIGEDTFFLWEALKRSAKIVVDPSAVYFYRKRDSSAITSYFNINHLDVLIAHKNILEDVKAHYPGLYSLALQRYVVAHMFALSLAIYAEKPDKKLIMRVASSLRLIIKAYLSTSNDNIIRKIAVIIGAYAFPIYRPLYRIYKGLK